MVDWEKKYGLEGQFGHFDLTLHFASKFSPTENNLRSHGCPTIFCPIFPYQPKMKNINFSHTFPLKFSILVFIPKKKKKKIKGALLSNTIDNKKIYFSPHSLENI